MLLSYPILGVVPTEVFADTAIDKISGTYPVTPGQAWHGGIHISFPATGGNEVRAIADGTVVAFRLPTEKPKDASALEKHPLNYCGWTDDGFVLLKHEKESGENTKVQFFSLYMHLSELPKSTFAGNPGAVQPGGDIKVKRKQKIGKLGSVYGQGSRMHFEIFTDDASLNAFFKRGKEKVKVDGQGCGDKDLWGDVHFVIPSGTTYYHDEPGAAPPSTSKKTEEVLCVTVQYAKGDRIVSVYRENGEQIGQQTSKEYKDNSGYEYNLYKLAQKRFPKNTSAGYELLRHGRVYGPDAAPPNATNWQYVPIGFGRHGWINLNEASIKKLSDADFPYWKWKLVKEDSGVFNPNDGKCEVAELLQAIDPDADGIVAPLEFKWLFKDQDAADRLKYMVCQFPCEWDATDAEKKWGWLKDYFKNPATLKKELAEKHKRWIEAVKTRTENQLKTAQGDLKTVQDAKKEKQTAAAEQQKKIAELAKQISNGEAQIKVHEKELTKLNKNHYAKPEDKEKAQKQLDDERKALDEKKTAKLQEQNVLSEAGQQLEDLEVAIKKLEAKMKDLDVTLKAVPKAMEAVDNDIKAAEAALKNPPTNADPDKSWKEFKAHMEALQWWDKVKLMASPSIWHFHPLAFIDHFKKCHWLSKNELEQIYPDKFLDKKEQENHSKILERYRASINKVFYKYGVSTPIRMSHYFGQGAVESGFLHTMQEKAMVPKKIENGNSYGDHIDEKSLQPEHELGHWYGSGKDEKNEWFCYAMYSSKGNLIASSYSWRNGNCGDLDAIKFRGRGFKQLTGLTNYSGYWVYRNWLNQESFDKNWESDSAYKAKKLAEMKKRVPAIEDPHRITMNPYNCIDIGGWYMSFQRPLVLSSIDRDANSERGSQAEENCVRAVTRAINGGEMDFENRLKYTRHAKDVLL